MKVIRFKRDSSKNWEIAFTKRDLYKKLNGEMATVVMPPRSWPIRLCRKFFPLKFVECQADGVERTVKLK